MNCEEKGKLFKDAYETIMKFQFNYYNKYKTTYDFFAEQQNIYEGDPAATEDYSEEEQIQTKSQSDELQTEMNEIVSELNSEEYSEIMSAVNEELGVEQTAVEQKGEYGSISAVIIIVLIVCVCVLTGVIVWLVKSKNNKNR